MKKILKFILIWYSKTNEYCFNNPIIFWIIGSPAAIISFLLIFKNPRNEFLKAFYAVSMITINVGVVYLSLAILVLIFIFLWCLKNTKKLNPHQKAIYLSLIQTTKDLLRLDDWQKWTYGVFTPRQVWPVDIIDSVERFRLHIFGCIWPKALPELERSLKTLSLVMGDARRIFLEHADLEDEAWRGIRFYKTGRWEEQERHDQLCQEYKEWTEKCDSLILEATKAVNWVADVIRRDLDPSFFATKGKFIVTEGPYEDMSTRTRSPEYSSKERKGMPYKELRH